MHILSLYRHYPQEQVQLALEQVTAYGRPHVHGVELCLQQRRRETAQPSLDLSEHSELLVVAMKGPDLGCYKQQRGFDLAQGEHISKTRSMILETKPGLAKAHIATGLAMATCRGRRPIGREHCAEHVDILGATHGQWLQWARRGAPKHDKLAPPTDTICQSANMGAVLMPHNDAATFS